VVVDNWIIAQLKRVSRKKSTYPAIPPKISGVQKWNFLGRMTGDNLNEEWTI
jgi:hypothetical protein